MAVATKPYPGMGDWVVLLLYGDVWALYRGAATRERANERRRELPQWPDHKIRVVENVSDLHAECALCKRPAFEHDELGACPERN